MCHMSDIVTCVLCCSAYFSSGWVKIWRSFLHLMTRDTGMGPRKKRRKMTSPKFVKFAVTNPQDTTLTPWPVRAAKASSGEWVNSCCNCCNLRKFTHPRVVAILYDLLSSVENKRRYLAEHPCGSFTNIREAAKKSSPYDLYATVQASEGMWLVLKV